MRNKFRPAALEAVAVAVAVPGLAAAPSARAVGPLNSVHCEIAGVMDTSGVGLMANTGTFTFDQIIPLTFTCSGQLNNGQYAGAATLVVPSSGTFTNVVCGTMTAGGTGNVTATAVAGNLAAGLNGGGFAYHIQFVAGTGPITGTATGPFGVASIAGTVTMVATGGGSTPNTTFCTDNFELASELTLT